MAALKLEVLLGAVDQMTAPVRRAMRATEGMSAAAKASKADLERLHKTQSKIESYKQQQQQLDTSRLKVELSRKSLMALDKQIRQSQKPSKKLLEQHKKAEKQHIALVNEEERRVVSLEKVKTEVEQLGVSTDNLSASEQRIQQEIVQSQRQWEQHAPALLRNQTALKDLQRTQRNLTSFQKMQSALDTTNVELKQQRQEVKRLKAEFSSTAKPTKTLTEALGKAENKLAALELKEKQQIAELKDLREALERAGLETHDLSGSQRKLTQEINRTNQAIDKETLNIEKQNRMQQKAIELARKRVKFQERLQKIQGMAFSATATGTASVYTAQQAIMPAAEHKDMIKDIAITGGLNRDAEVKLAADLRKVALDTNQHQAEINKGVQILVANGMEAVEAGDYAELLGDTATATRARMEDASNLTFTLKNAFKITGKEDMETAMNNLVHAGKQGQFEFRDMARYFPSLAASMASMGATGQEAVKELAMAMQAARKSAGTSEEAAANTANWFSHMTSSSTIDNFEKVGIDFKKEIMKRTQDGKMSALFASFEVFDEYIDKLTKGQVIKIRDSKGRVKERLDFRSALAAAQKSGNSEEVEQIISRFGLSKILQDMQTTNFYLAMRQNKDFLQKGMASYNSPEVGNTIAHDKQRRLESPIEQFKAAKVQFNDTLTDFGNALLPELIPLIKQVTELTGKVSQWAKENPQLVSTIAKVVVAVGAALLVFGSLATVIVGILGPLALARFALGGIALKGGGVVGSLIGLLSWLIKAGVGLLAFAGRLSFVGVLLGRVAAGAALSKLAGGVMMAVKAFRVLGMVLMANPIGVVVGLIAGAAYLIYKNWDTVKQYLETFWDIVKPYFQATWDWIKTLFSWTPLGMITSNWDTIKNYFTDFWPTIKQVMEIAWQAIKTALTWSPLGVIMNNWNTLKDFYKNLWGSIEVDLTTWLQELPAKFTEFGSMLMRGLADGITAGTTWVKDKVLGLGSSIKGWFTGETEIHSPSRVFFGYGRYIDQGLAGGIEQYQQLPVQKVTGLARKVLMPFSQTDQQQQIQKTGFIQKLLMGAGLTLPLLATPAAQALQTAQPVLAAQARPVAAIQPVNQLQQQLTATGFTQALAAPVAQALQTAQPVLAAQARPVAAIQPVNQLQQQLTATGFAQALAAPAAQALQTAQPVLAAQTQPVAASQPVNQLQQQLTATGFTQILATPVAQALQAAQPVLAAPTQSVAAIQPVNQLQQQLTATGVTQALATPVAQALQTAQAQQVARIFAGSRREYLTETRQERQDYHDYRLSRQHTGPTKQAPSLPAPAAPITLNIEVHATPGMDEQLLVELIESRIRNRLRQSDYSRRHQLFDGYKQ